MEQLFYVNDLGAQIGLTALGYSRIYDQLKPQMKIDQWIGTLLSLFILFALCDPHESDYFCSGNMYAIMNTFSELQKLGLKLRTPHLLF